MRITTHLCFLIKFTSEILIEKSVNCLSTLLSVPNPYFSVVVIRGLNSGVSFERLSTLFVFIVSQLSASVGETGALDDRNGEVVELE